MREYRASDEMRSIEITLNYTKHAEGSVLISFGNTKVLCNATVEEKIPPFIKEKNNNSGWITAEYNMLPRSTHVRTPRERLKQSGRTLEIQRLIGRSLRSVVNLEALGPRTILIDCDVIEADGGTRTASISGAYMAMILAMKRLQASGIITEIPVIGNVAAISVGKCNGQYLLDLDYNEDHVAEVDMNIVMTDREEFIEIQGSGEKCPFSYDDLSKFLEIAKIGIKNIIQRQNELNTVLPLKK